MSKISNYVLWYNPVIIHPEQQYNLKEFVSSEITFSKKERQATIRACLKMDFLIVEGMIESKWCNFII